MKRHTEIIEKTLLKSTGEEAGEFYSLLLSEYNDALSVRKSLIKAKFRKVLKRFKHTQVDIEVLINPPSYYEDKLDDDENETSTLISYHVILTNRRKDKKLAAGISDRIVAVLKRKGLIFDDELAIYRDDGKGTLDYYFYDEIDDVVAYSKKFGRR